MQKQRRIFAYATPLSTSTVTDGKNGLEDIQKAIWYLNKAVELDGQIKKENNDYYRELKERVKEIQT